MTDADDETFTQYYEISDVISLLGHKMVHLNTANDDTMFITSQHWVNQS